MIRSMQLLLLFLILVHLPGSSYAQSWGAIIHPDRAIDWSATAGVEGGIPNRTIICATLSPGATATDINSALAACPAGQVVYLNAGTYNLTSGITFSGVSNVTLRGAGSSQTKLIFTGGAPCVNGYVPICMKGSSNNYPQVTAAVDWTAGYARGTTVIAVADGSSFNIGEVLVLDQCNDGLSGTSCTGTESARWPDASNGAAAGAFSIEGPVTGDARLNVRMQQQVVKITGKNGNNLAITPGLIAHNWRPSQAPQVWKIGTVAGTGFRNGVENLSLDYTSAGGNSGLQIINAYENWIYRVRGIGPSRRNAVWVQMAARNEIRDSYFYGSGGSSTSYGIECWVTTGNLIVNNILHKIVTPYIEGVGCTANVLAFNHWFDTTRQDFPNAMGGMLQHDAGASFNLYEGNQGTSWLHDTFHGNSNFTTAFRNLFTGSDQVNFPNQTQCTHPVSIWSLHQFFNVVGNVLGEAGYHSAYEAAYPAAPSNKAIFNLGHRNGCGSSVNTPDDTNVKASLLRWGNYDVATATDRFLASEVPTELTRHANPVPASQALPASLFLFGQPSWWVTPWGTPAWPPVGPDVTGGNVAGYGGRVWKNPARLCFENSAVDPAYGGSSVRAFNAALCYASPVAPAPPTNLRLAGVS